VPPYAEPAYAQLRGSLALSKPGTTDGALDLDGTFGLHPALENFHAMYRAREALVLHAAATPYRERSHFDAQNVLEDGGTAPNASGGGWLNRALSALAAAGDAQRTFAVRAADDEPGGNDRREDKHGARLRDELARRRILGVQLREGGVDCRVEVLPLLGRGVGRRLRRGRATGDGADRESGGRSKCNELGFHTIPPSGDDSAAVPNRYARRRRLTWRITETTFQAKGNREARARPGPRDLRC